MTANRSAAFVMLAALAVAFTALSPGALAAQVQGTVFLDANGNGARDEGEAGLQGVMVSDGLAVVDTAADGGYQIEAAATPALVWVSAPRDHRPVGSFCRWSDGSKPADLPLQASQQPDEYLFIQITDTHIGRADLLKEFCARVNDLPLQVQFVVNTGDLMGGVDVVVPEQAPRQYDAYVQAVAVLKPPLFNVPGNHEHVGFNNAQADGNHPFFGKGLYPLMLGPMHYSWDWGPVHFIALDGTRMPYAEALGDEQLAWLAEDLKRQPAGKPLILFCHQSLLQIRDRDKLRELLSSHRVLGAFCGHLHANWQQEMDGFTVFQTGALSGAWWSGPDPEGSPQGFRLIAVRGDGLSNAYFSREGPLSLNVANPRRSEVQKGVVPIEATVLDFGRDVALKATCGGVDVPLSRGERTAWWSLWTGRLDTTALPDSLAKLDLTASGDGQETRLTMEFIADNGKTAPSSLQGDALLKMQVRGVDTADIVEWNGAQLGVMEAVPNESWLEFKVPAASLRRLTVLTVRAVAPEGKTNKDDFSIGPVRLEAGGQHYYDLRQATFMRYQVGDGNPATYADNVSLYFCLP